MSINILSNSTKDLSTILIGGIQPYDPCTRWEGGFTASNGTTGQISATGTTAATGTPYINSSNSPCAIPGTNKASLTGVFHANGFTGTANIWIYVKDASGVEGESNHISYNVLPSGSLTVYAGLDQTVTTGSGTVSFLGATASNGTPAYSWLWTEDPSNPETVTFSSSTAQSPTATSFSQNGDYIFNLLATDSMGKTGTDSVKITVSGNTPPGPPSSALAWTAGLTGPNNIPYFEIARKRGATVTYPIQEGSLGNTGGTFSIGSGSNQFQQGDGLRVLIQAVSGGMGSATSSIWARLERVSRVFPYTQSIVWQVNDSDPSGNLVKEYGPGPSTPNWTTLDVTNYHYILTAWSTVY